MKYEKIPLHYKDSEAYLECYVADAINNCGVRDAILVIPGGGYSGVCADREGEPIALSFLAKGFQAFVLHYSVGEKAVFPRPLIEASLAMAYIRDNAAALNVDPGRVFVTGFSAGGHLCAALGTCWHLKEVWEEAGIPYGKNKPTGMIPVYAVISTQVATHLGSFYNILGTATPTDEELKRWSLDLRVDENTVPACIIHTSADHVVPVANALALAKAMVEHNIQMDLHIWSIGEHGIALANKVTWCGNPIWDLAEAAHWPEIVFDWSKRIPSVK